MSAARSVAVTVVGNDRPGIVAGVTKTLYELGCNLQDVSSTILSGHFSMVLIVTASVAPEEIETALASVAQDMDLVVTARPVHGERASIESPSHMVSVYGADRPGIVYRVTELLAGHSVNITDLSSRVIGSEEQPVYALMLEVAMVDVTETESALKKLATELGVEVSVTSIESDLL